MKIVLLVSDVTSERTRQKQHELHATYEDVETEPTNDCIKAPYLAKNQGALLVIDNQDQAPFKGANCRNNNGSNVFLLIRHRIERTERGFLDGVHSFGWKDPLPLQRKDGVAPADPVSSPTRREVSEARRAAGIKVSSPFKA